MSGVTVPRGLRNHNPLNIRHTPGTKWLGEAGSDGAFCLFVDNLWGYRAAFRVLMTYNKCYGIFSVRGIIERWAPPADGNDTRAYIRRVCELSGLRETDIVVADSEDEEDNYRAMALVRAMAMVENGCGEECLPMDEIATGLEMAKK